jgi:hypothetical protein
VIEVETQMTKTMVETTWHEFESHLKEVEARAACIASELSTTEAQADCRTGGITGSSAGAVQLPKFDRLTSWAVF